MKKFFTLIAASFLTIAVFAADRKPVVTLTASRNYEIVIDGRSYSGSSINLSNLRNGKHTIQVFERNRVNVFRKKSRLIDAETFQVKNRDIDIYVDARGQISITEAKRKNSGRDKEYGYDKKDKRDRDWNDNDDRNDRNRQ
ncbi:MAG: hypothetical protein H7Y42_10145 [Chitinophagaceae bacterium]|nr:hypothetical protein [Chitinophagaceae bacterium]